MERIVLPIFDDVAWNQEKINVGNLKILLNKMEHFYFVREFRYIKKLYLNYIEVIKDCDLNWYEYLKSKINSLDDYQKGIDSIIDNCNADSMIVSSTHLSTYYTLKSLKSNNKKIFIICFDAHSDTCSALRPAWKGNVFSKLLQETIIDGLIIISGNRLKSIKDKRVLVLKYSSKTVNEIKHFLHNNDVEKLYFSFDIDVLNTYSNHLTAMEYNSFNVLRHLSLQNGNSVKSIFDLYNIVKKSIKIPNNYGYKNLYKSGFSGISLNEIEKVLYNIVTYAKKNNIDLGLENNDGHKIYADIVEYYGYDYKNKTIDCIDCFVNKFERSIKDEKNFC